MSLSESDPAQAATATHLSPTLLLCDISVAADWQHDSARVFNLAAAGSTRECGVPQLLLLYIGIIEVHFSLSKLHSLVTLVINLYTLNYYTGF